MEMEARPPYAAFERRAVEDRAASLANGYFTAKNVDFVIVTPPGGKLTFEHPAEEWLANVENISKTDPTRFPPAWARHFKELYRAWRNEEELPEAGVPVKGWPLISPAQQLAVLQANIRTVEDLAQATEEGISAIGMGGRTLKQKAIDWLAAKGDAGAKLASKLEELQVRNSEQKAHIEKLEAQIASLAAKLPKETAKA